VSVRFGRNLNDADDDTEMDQDGDDDNGHETWQRFHFAEDDVSAIYVQACGGDDRVRIGKHLELATTILGGEGNDELRAGAGPALIEDLAGDNKVWGGDGNDTIRTGSGN